MPECENMGNLFVAKLVSVTRSPFLDGTVPENVAGETNVNDLAPVKTIRLLSSLMLAIVSAYGVFVIIKNIMDLGPAIEQKDTASIGSAVKGIIGGAIMAFAGGILSFLGFTV